jgi:hypothetical protein
MVSSVEALDTTRKRLWDEAVAEICQSGTVLVVGEPLPGAILTSVYLSVVSTHDMEAEQA